MRELLSAQAWQRTVGDLPTMWDHPARGDVQEFPS